MLQRVFFATLTQDVAMNRPAEGCRHETLRQIIRFGQAGVVNTAFGYAAYVACVLAGLTPWVSLLVATPLGMLFNFFTPGRFVFGNKSLRLLPRFIVASAVLYVINLLLLRMFLAAGSGPLLAQIWCVCLLVPLTFVIFRRGVFHGKADSAADDRNGNDSQEKS